MTETIVTWFFAVVFSLIGWGSLFHFSWIIRNWPEARARVVGNVQEYSKSADSGFSESIVHFAELEFSAKGVIHRIKGSVGHAKAWSLGETVTLHYKPENPEHILDCNTWQRYMFSGVFILFGGASAAVLAGYIS